MKKYLIHTFVFLLFCASTVDAMDLRSHADVAGAHAQNDDFYFVFYDPTDLYWGYRTTAPTIVAGDCKIQKDGGTWNNCDNLPAWNGEGTGKLQLTADELDAAIILINLVDQTDPPEWIARTLQPHTGGASGALHYTAP